MNPLEQALKILDEGGVVGMPTETVYGLAARIDREAGLKAIFATKQRPFFDPLIVHVASREQAQSLTTGWNAITQALAEAFWPGPLTMVLPKTPAVSSLITSGLTTVGLRCPSHPVARQLIEAAGQPLAAPSANLFGRTSPTTAEHVEREFEGRVFVLDGGPSSVGIESTIVSVAEDGDLRLLRPGSITREQITSVLQKQQLSFRWVEQIDKIMAPGQMKHHYMPSKPLILTRRPMRDEELLQQIRSRLAELPQEVEGVRLFRPPQVERVSWLTLAGDPVLAARQLYQALRESGESSADVLALVWPQERREGAWLAVWDRLRKAASLDLEH